MVGTNVSEKTTASFFMVSEHNTNLQHRENVRIHTLNVVDDMLRGILRGSEGQACRENYVLRSSVISCVTKFYTDGHIKMDEKWMGM